MQGQFVDSYDPTIENSKCNENDFKSYSLLFTLFIIIFTAFTKVTRINSMDYEIKLVDTAGQDEYSIFPTQYSMDFHGYVLVYSITSQKSFEVIQIIYEKLLDVMGKAQYVLHAINII